jgi:chromosome segregation ATPase
MDPDGDGQVTLGEFSAWWDINMGSSRKGASAAGGLAELDALKEENANLKSDIETLKGEDGSNFASDALRAELQRLKISELRKRATAASVDATRLEEAEDSEMPKDAIINLVVEIEAEKLASGPSDDELQKLKAGAIEQEAELARVNEELERVISDIDGKVEEAVAALEEERDVLASEKQALEQFNSELEDKLDSKTQEVASLAAEAETVNKQLKDSMKPKKGENPDEELCRWKNDAQKYEKKLAKANAELKDAQNDRRERANEEKDRRTFQANESAKERSSRTQETRKDRKQQTTQARRDRKMTKNTAVQRQKMMGQGMGMGMGMGMGAAPAPAPAPPDGKLASVTAEVETLRRQLNEQMKPKSGDESSTDELQRWKATAMEHETTVAKASAELEALQAQMNTADEEKKGLEAANAALLAEAESNKEMVASLQAEANSAKTDGYNVDANMHELEEAKAKLDVLESDAVAIVSDTGDDLGDDIPKWRKKVAAFEKLLTIRDEEIVALNAKASSMLPASLETEESHSLGSTAAAAIDGGSASPSAAASDDKESSTAIASVQHDGLQPGATEGSDDKESSMGVASAQNGGSQPGATEGAEAEPEAANTALLAEVEGNKDTIASLRAELEASHLEGEEMAVKLQELAEIKEKFDPDAVAVVSDMVDDPGEDVPKWREKVAAVEKLLAIRDEEIASLGQTAAQGPAEGGDSAKLSRLQAVLAEAVAENNELIDALKASNRKAAEMAAQYEELEDEVQESDERLDEATALTQSLFGQIQKLKKEQEAAAGQRELQARVQTLEKLVVERGAEVVALTGKLQASHSVGGAAEAAANADAAKWKARAKAMEKLVEEGEQELATLSLQTKRQQRGTAAASDDL